MVNERIMMVDKLVVSGEWLLAMANEWLIRMVSDG